jgi:hypothetical protein
MLLFSLTGFFAFGVDGNNLSVVKYAEQVLQDSTSKALKRSEGKRARIATVLSAVVPGAGQVYNKKYWKVPVIYTAFAGFGYLFMQNNIKYQTYHKALLYRYDDDASTIDELSQYSDDNLIALKTQYRKYRDLSGIGIGIVYIFNIIDANVDAHLYKFDQKISDDVTLSIRPYHGVGFNNNTQIAHGLTIRLKFN